MTSPLSRGVGLGRTLTTAPPVNFLDFSNALSQRSATFSFTLVEAASNGFKQTLTPYADTVPQLSHDTTRTVKRQLNVALGPADVGKVDTIRDRVLVSMVLPDGSVYPLGRYMFTDNTRALYTSGTLGALTLTDEMFLLDQPLSTAFPSQAQLIANGSSTTSVSSLIRQLIAGYPGLDIVIEATNLNTNTSWAQGTTAGQVLGDLASLGDYFPTWFGNDTILHAVRTFDPATKVPDLDWDAYPHVYADTVTETDDLLSAPNRIIVVSNNLTSDTQHGPVMGSYDVPASAPHSIQNRGFVVPDIRQVQVDSEEQAAAMARSIGIQQTVYQRTTVTTFPDPRHDSYDVVRWQGENWLELAWSMDLIEGGNMTHTMRKTYR